jgi:16S rRNA (cytosine1402-N4)-methyltransferase
MPYKHIAVMLPEVIGFLNLRPGKIYVDGTLGGAGHSKAICEKIFPTGILIGIDQDVDAIVNARQALMPYAPNVHLIHDNFVHLDQILTALNIKAVDGILLDLGLSLNHIENSGRGFSFSRNEPLDMRMNTKMSVKAENLVNEWDAHALEKIFRDYGEERWAKSIAQHIVAARGNGRIRSTGELERIVVDAIPRSRRHDRKIHPATKVFMALRIAVNQELAALDGFMSKVIGYLNSGGRLCVLSYHSLEDRIVKSHMRACEKGCVCPPDFPTCICGKTPQLRMIARRVLRPSSSEIAANPMSRSAKLRVAEKL